MIRSESVGAVNTIPSAPIHLAPCLSAICVKTNKEEDAV